jgi:hypothetical protein
MKKHKYTIIKISMVVIFLVVLINYILNSI